MKLKTKFSKNMCYYKPSILEFNLLIYAIAAGWWS